MNVVRGHFRPEFLNHLDDIVIFQPLSREQLRQITVIQMQGKASGYLLLLLLPPLLLLLPP